MSDEKQPIKKKTTAKRGRKKTSDSSISFSKIAKDPNQADLVNNDTILQSIRTNLSKSVSPRDVDENIAQKVDQSKVTFSAHENNYSADSVEMKGWRRVDDTEQKEIAQIDPYISAMISKRCSQTAIVGRESDSKFDKGTRIRELQPLSMEDFETKDDFQKARDIRTKQMRTVMTWIKNCGTTDKTVIDTAFAGQDKLFKYCTFAEFLVAQTRNLMTFGRCATQILRNSDGLPVMFRPVPVETILMVKDGAEAPLVSDPVTAEQSKTDAKEYNQIPENERPLAYVQRVNGRNVNFFTEDDLRITYFQKQALLDLGGYPLSPIELAIYMVFIHQQTLGYLRNAFVKGLGSKGILSIESTDPNVQLSPEDMEELRRSFHNYVSRNDNAVAMPVISGPMSVKFTSLVASPREMEFLQLEEHVIRALCSAFQVSPQEMGYGHLSIGQGGLTQANKQEDVVRGEETGLRMLLDSLYDTVNAILYESFPRAEELFSITYVGVGEDTRDTVVGRHAQELSTTATLGSLWADSEKKDGVPFGGDVPLSSVFHENIINKMKYGEYREHFLGEEGASKIKEYDFIIDPSLNSAYQQLRTQPVSLQQEMAVAGFEQQQQQIGQANLQGQLMQQQAQQPAEDQQPENSQKEQPEVAEKSLSDIYGERQKLRKSVGYYLSEWYDLNS